MVKELQVLLQDRINLLSMLLEMEMVKNQNRLGLAAMFSLILFHPINKDTEPQHLMANNYHKEDG